jgi:3-hydroxyisobutyrate dehydrogenase-like beta-hydroxyacid dehydrogenase
MRAIDLAVPAGRKRMSEVSVLGLGAMGSALARVLLQKEYDVTVWNRSPEKKQPLVEAGARAAVTAAEALQASPVIFICVADYEATKEMLSGHDIARQLAGRTLVQLSTGTSREARESEAWVTQLGGEYLDGAIIAYPDHIGTEVAKILIAGLEGSFERCKHVLECLGGVIYVGTGIGAAAALDMALLSYYLSLYLGVIQGAHLCESEGVGIEVFASLLERGAARALAKTIHKNDYTQTDAPIRVWAASVHRIQAQAHDSGSSQQLPDFLVGVLKRAMESGHGESDIAALIEVLRHAR